MSWNKRNNRNKMHGATIKISMCLKHDYAQTALPAAE